MWPVMMDDDAPTQKRRKLVKTYKKMWNSLPAAVAEAPSLASFKQGLTPLSLYIVLKILFFSFFLGGGGYFFQ